MSEKIHDLLAWHFRRIRLETRMKELRSLLCRIENEDLSTQGLMFSSMDDKYFEVLSLLISEYRTAKENMLEILRKIYILFDTAECEKFTELKNILENK